MTPDFRTSIAFMIEPSQWRLWNVDTITSAFFAAAIIASHSFVVIAKGFSHTTWRPALRHFSASGAWVLWGVISTTRFTSDLASMSSTFENVWMPGNSCAATARRAASGSATARGVIPAFCMSCRCILPMLKAPP